MTDTGVTVTDTGKEPEEPVVWEEPPNPNRGGKGGAWVDKLKPLMSNPGQSAIVYVSRPDMKKAAEKVAYSLRHRKIKIPDGEWEFTSRWIVSENVSKVYAKYLGPEESKIIAPAVARETTEEYEKRHQALGGV